jgi:hypothetical protein
MALPPRATILPLSALLVATTFATGCACCQRHDGVAKASSSDAGGWRSLFDGKSLAGWKETDFGGAGAVTVDPKFRGGAPAFVINAGATLSGITLTNPPPAGDYEVELEALKIDGGDFFCGLTFPVGNSHATLVMGGWGGATVGISSIDGLDASENETTRFLTFAKDKWFHIRLRVTKDRIQVWLDRQEKPEIDQDIVDKRISMRFGEIELSMPFGIATYQTSSAVRSVKWRPLPARAK